MPLKVHYFHVMHDPIKAACGKYRKNFEEGSADWTKVNCKGCLKRRGKV